MNVVEGGFGRRPEDDEDNALIVSQLEEWLARAKDRKIIAFAIAAVTADDHVLTQFAPSAPRNVFTLFGAVNHIAQRVGDTIEK